MSSMSAVISNMFVLSCELGEEVELHLKYMHNFLVGSSFLISLAELHDAFHFQNCNILLLWYCWHLVLLIMQEWLKRYSQRRYGKSVHKVEAAWEILHGTIYNCTDGIAVRFLSNKSTGCSMCLLLISLVLSKG